MQPVNTGPAITLLVFGVPYGVVATQLNIGDILAYSSTAGAIPFVHRIINIREEAGTRIFTTQGDANRTPDPKEMALPPNTWQLWYSVPWLGYLINFSFSRLCFVLFILIPLLGRRALMLKDRVLNLRQSHAPSPTNRQIKGVANTRLT